MKGEHTYFCMGEKEKCWEVFVCYQFRNGMLISLMEGNAYDCIKTNNSEHAWREPYVVVLEVG